MRRIARACDPIIDIGAEIENLLASFPFDPELDGNKRHIVDYNAAFLDRRDEEVLIPLTLEHGGEELDQGGTSNRRLEIKPSAICCDAHVEIAAERRIPKVDGRRPFSTRFACRPRDGIQSHGLELTRHWVAHVLSLIAAWLPCLGHGFTGTCGLAGCSSRERDRRLSPSLLTKA